jgi:hypothetical protein
MATAAFAGFLVSSLSLISIAGRQWGALKRIILSTKKSSIDGNQYLDYLLESGDSRATFSGVGESERQFWGSLSAPRKLGIFKFMGYVS